MKTLFLSSTAFACLLSVTLVVSAEDNPPVKSILFQDGKVLVFRIAGKGEPITNEVSMTPGVKINTNGSFTVGSGISRQFLEGQRLDSDGNLTSPDGVVQPIEDHVVMKQGHLMLVKDGVATKATKEVLLGDGTRLKPDGTILTSDGHLRRMLDGQISKFNGASIASTDTVTIKDGVVVLQKDGGRVTLKRGQTITMSDGSKVASDGTVIRPDGTKIKVAEGEIYKLPGVSAAKR
ncbi:MAG: hypothetical protein QOF48_452 [Verrucomicrobiota bacterium]|jgi:hypothetical protein